MCDWLWKPVMSLGMGGGRGLAGFVSFHCSIIPPKRHATPRVSTSTSEMF